MSTDWKQWVHRSEYKVQNTSTPRRQSTTHDKSTKRLRCISFEFCEREQRVKNKSCVRGLQELSKLFQTNFEFTAVLVSSP